MGVSPRMEVAPVQRPPAPPHQTAPSWLYPSIDAPSTSYMPMGPPPMSFPHMGTLSLQPMSPPAFTPIYPQATAMVEETGTMSLEHPSWTVLPCLRHRRPHIPLLSSNVQSEWRGLQTVIPTPQITCVRNRGRGSGVVGVAS
ncbi:hypothetical protein U9M48_027385, partial [Paspalum notatum var. saurae]